MTGKPLNLTGAEHVHAVRVAERRGQPSFAQKALALLVVAEITAEELERDAPSAVQLFRFVHLSHAAFTERPDDQVGTEALVGRKEKGQVNGNARRPWRERARRLFGRP